jgi:hypothetical protein
MNKEPEKIFVELIQKSLNLPNNWGYDTQGNEIPCVTIKSQNIKLYNTEHLQVTIGTLSSNIFSNRKANIFINALAFVFINIFAFGSDLSVLRKQMY